MTTHDDQTLTGSYDESRTAAQRTPPVGEHTAPNPSSVPPGDPRTSFGDSAPDRQAPAAPQADMGSEPVGRHNADGESSADSRLFAEDELADLRARWTAVQAAFVDDPKECVHKADSLVADLVEQLTTGFAHARSCLEEQWARGHEASTEDLRVALTHYREFFERLLAV